MRKGLSYTQRTLRECRDRGYVVDKCEKFNAYAGPFGRREDLFGFIDLIALDPARGIVAIQSTGPSGHSQHRKKILECEHAVEWLNCGGIIELWSWHKKLINRQGKLKTWQPRIEAITELNFGTTYITQAKIIKVTKDEMEINTDRGLPDTVRDQSGVHRLGEEETSPGR